ncbi:MAG: helix-turn-helix domain-containing protein [Acidobacteriota bacterium]|nr:helix-turn-helix domain-containing protein [Acidobacteriota bacterium]
MGESTNTLRLLTVAEVAQWLAVSPSWVRDHAAGRRRPGLPCIRLGRSLRFREDDLAEWLAVLHRDWRST